MRAIDQQTAGPRSLLVRHPHAVDDGFRLRSPIEKNAEHAENPSVALSALADGGRVGGGLSVVENGIHRDVVDRALVAVPGGERVAEPRLSGDVRADRATESIRTAVREDRAVGADDPKVEIDGVGVEDDPHALGRVGETRRGRFAGRRDDGEPSPGVARARRLDQGVESENFRGVGDGLNLTFASPVPKPLSTTRRYVRAFVPSPAHIFR